MKKTIVFTDLDGTLLDAETYSFEPALPALTLLKEKSIPLIICSSKTKKEIEYYRDKLENYDPFISENGGGIFIPTEYFKSQISDFKFEENGDYHVIRLGARYADLREAIKELRNEGFNVRGFGDMTAEELANIANMSIHEARMAKERDFDEPFILEGNQEELQKLFTAINSKGFNYTQGRFFHILGNSDKGKAVSIMIDMFKKKFGNVFTVAIGNSPNDVPMLERVEYPVIVKRPDGSYESINIPGLIRADGIGPVGWKEAILYLFQSFSSLK